jgi:hypothetical protein
VKRQQICHLAVNSLASFKFDELISSYDQVFKIGRGMAHSFLTLRSRDKLVINVADQFATNNNCGFNLANFKQRFVHEYFEDVVKDYERSFIGSFASAVFDTLDATSELYFSISKFEGNMGYSLTENPVKSYDDGALGGTNEEGFAEKRNSLDDTFKRETIPEFVRVRQVGHLY